MNDIAINLDGTGLSIGIVRSRFNESIGLAMLEACRARLTELGVSPAQVDAISVPGGLEVPLALQALAVTDHYDALIALGAVIRGDTYHFEIVSNESASGISSVALDTGIPIANGILTTETDEQAEVRASQKARDCAEVAVEMANLLRAVARAYK
ncbi:MAG: 6,7-dimethyl-8-ribityllumazine synthase [Burkholderiales bacterium RIFCSPLOWO2_12_FULL_64_99]|nr:MAG: 6,7-dimethyl-8-ribityllumazine synthase [Burkholderiales bacterium RIFCSPLOWO2_12_FULL_64_99]